MGELKTWPRGAAATETGKGAPAGEDPVRVHQRYLSAGLAGREEVEEGAVRVPVRPRMSAERNMVATGLPEGQVLQEADRAWALWLGGVQKEVRQRVHRHRMVSLRTASTRWNLGTTKYFCWGRTGERKRGTDGGKRGSFRRIRHTSLWWPQQQQQQGRGLSGRTVAASWRCCCATSMFFWTPWPFRCMTPRWKRASLFPALAACLNSDAASCASCATPVATNTHNAVSGVLQSPPPALAVTALSTHLAITPTGSP